MLKKITIIFLKSFRTGGNNEARIVLTFFFLSSGIGLTFLFFQPKQHYLNEVDVMSKSITYYRVKLDRSLGGGRYKFWDYFIIISSHDTEYKLWQSLWENHYSRERILNSLQKTDQARIWFSRENPTNLIGIETYDISISPTIGIKIHNDGRFILLILISFSFFLGSFVYLSPYFLRKLEQQPIINTPKI